MYPLLILWSLFPILTYMVLLLLFRIKALVAAPIAFCCATVTGMTVFKAKPDIIMTEVARGIWNTVVIFYVVFTAMLIYEALSEANMFDRIGAAMQALIRDKTLRILFVGWGFTSFLQGITGFGVPVAVAAPILVKMGIGAIPAVVICILGHAWGGTFGTLAIAWDNLLSQAGILPENAASIALHSCVMLWIYNLICGIAICRIVCGKNVRGRDLFHVLCISTAQGGVQLLVARFNTSVACFLAAAVSIAVIFILDRRSERPGFEKTRSGVDGVTIKDICLPFLFLIVVVLVLSYKPIAGLLPVIQFGPVLPDGNGGYLVYSPINLSTHSGTLLLATGLFTLIFYRSRSLIQKQSFSGIVIRTADKSVRSIIPILFLISMSKVMNGAGHIAVLSEGAAMLFGFGYPVFAPFVGIFGSFITSSNMSSNILFASFQKNTALFLGVDPRITLAAQTSGGSIGNLLATSNIVLGLTTTGSSGQEGIVFRSLLPICIISALACSAVALLLYLGFQ